MTIEEIKALVGFGLVIKAGCKYISSPAQEEHCTIAFLTPKGKVSIFTNGFIRKSTVIPFSQDTSRLTISESVMERGTSGQVLIRNERDWNRAFNRAIEIVRHSNSNIEKIRPLSEWDKLFEQAKETKNFEGKKYRTPKSKA